jgi:sulfite reductase (NADPH) hemoprotein beta-component
MYLYTDFDQQLINQRVAQFRDQTERYLAGKLTEDEYRPLRLQNGLYVQRYAPMLRIAVPYGLMNTKQLRKIAEIATEYDRGYAHVSTRQNIQLNWPALENVPDILLNLQQYKCMQYKPQVTVFVTPRLISLQVWLLVKLLIHVQRVN